MNKFDKLFNTIIVEKKDSKKKVIKESINLKKSQKFAKANLQKERDEDKKLEQLLSHESPLFYGAGHGFYVLPSKDEMGYYSELDNIDYTKLSPVGRKRFQTQKRKRAEQLKKIEGLGGARDKKCMMTDE